MATGHLIPQLTTSIPLGAGGVFTSPWMPVEDLATVRISVHTNVDGILHTQHSSDGASIVRDSLQPVVGNRAEFLSFHPRSTYFRIVYNNGSLTQANFHLETHFMFTAAAPTQSLVSATLGRTSLAQQSRSILYDYKYDTHASILPGSRDLLTTERQALIADAFVDPAVDTANWVTTVTGSGSSAISAKRLLLATGTTVNSTVKFVSAAVGRFVAGNIQGHKSGIELPDVGTANNKRRWGSYDDNDGYFYELDGTTLYAVGRKGGVDTRTSAANWNVINTFTLTASGVYSMEISYLADVAYFIINDEVHHIMVAQGFKGSFPNRFENLNSGGSTTNVSLLVRGTTQHRYGPGHTAPRFRYLSGAATTTLKVGPGHIHRIICANDTGANVAVVYDNTAGSGIVISNLSVNKAPATFEVGADFQTGLTVVTTGATTKMTVVYD